MTWWRRMFWPIKPSEDTTEFRRTVVGIVLVRWLVVAGFVVALMAANHLL